MCTHNCKPTSAPPCTWYGKSEYHNMNCTFNTERGLIHHLFQLLKWFKDSTEVGHAFSRRVIESVGNVLILYFCKTYFLSSIWQIGNMQRNRLILPEGAQGALLMDTFLCTRNICSCEEHCLFENGKTMSGPWRAILEFFFTDHLLCGIQI